MTKMSKSKPHETVIDCSNPDPVPETPVEAHRDDRDTQSPPAAPSDDGAERDKLVSSKPADDTDHLVSTPHWRASTRGAARFKKVYPDAQTPQYQSAGAACFDLHAYTDGYVPPGGAATFGTGIAVEIPEGYALKIYSRSSHGKEGIRLANGTGIIDSDYRGELVVTLANDHRNAAFEVVPGDRIAQAMICPADQWDLIEVDELSATARGSNGHGSTGK